MAKITTEAPELASLAQPLATELTLKLLRVPNMPAEPPAGRLVVRDHMASQGTTPSSKGTHHPEIVALLHWFSGGGTLEGARG